MNYTIQKDNLEVTIKSEGAEMISIRYQGKERLWQNEQGEWKDHSPLLFPICGHFNVTIEGKTYRVPAHGFARKFPFTLTKQTSDCVVLSLQANEKTKAMYPYDFILHMIYQIKDNKLYVSYQVENIGNSPLYMACGGHDAFITESGDMSKYKLVFDGEEHFVHYHHNVRGYLTGKVQDFGVSNTLVLPNDLLQNGDTLILKGIKSNKVTLCEVETGKKLVALTFEGYDNLLCWREAELNFICIEPWTNLPDYVRAEKQEFSTKDGIVCVEGNTTKTFTRIVELF